MKGRFITLEGGEGTGKSTQIKLLAEWLNRCGVETVLTKEPGGTPIGRELRQMLCTGDKDKFDAVAEALLYYADRRIHMQQKVLPALEDGKWVISDRFADSTMAYQYYGYNKRVPNLTIILDLDPRIGLERSLQRNGTAEIQETRHESRGNEFHQNLRRGFLEIAQTSPRYVVVNADQSIEQLHHDIVKIVEERLLKP